MKNSGKVLIFIFLAMAGIQTYAQKFGIQGGLNLSKMLVKDDDGTYSDEFKMNPGFNAGVTLDLGFGKMLSLEAGLFADSKGFKWDYEGVTSKAGLLYLDVPVLLKVGPKIGPARVFGAVGPYVGMGITGKMSSKADGNKESEDIKWGNTEDDDLKRLDYGAKFGAGVEILSFSFGAYYSLGLANLEASPQNGEMTKNRVLSFSLGYRF